jgi:hypothetical protein
VEFVIIPLVAVLYLIMGIVTLIRRGSAKGALDVLMVGGLWPFYVKSVWAKPHEPEPKTKKRLRP